MKAQDRQARLDEETARKKRKVVHQTEGEKDPSPGGESPAEATPSPSARPMEASSSSTTTTATVSPPPSTDRPQAQDGDGDEMMDDGIPLATPEAINMSGKREATEVGDDEVREGGRDCNVSTSSVTEWSSTSRRCSVCLE